MMKKLLNKKGSVLFLVVVVMSILIVAASATFYIVNNQQSSVNVRYSSEQSYQTAVSVSDTVSKYIDGYIAAISSSGNEMTKYKDTIIGKMVAMSTGTSNDITSDIPLDDSMGKAKVTIRKKDTKTSGDNTIHIFEITTDSDVNGETVTITQVKEIVTGPTEYFTRFLTSTGNHPDDVNVTADKIISGTYFENDFTRLSNATMNESIYSSGTFYNNGIKFNAPTKEIVIAENFYNYGFGNAVECGKIYVGGNLESSSTFTADEIYVMGDVIFKQDLTGGTYYVNGDIYLDNINTGGCVFYVNGSVYFSHINKAQGKFYVKKDIVINDWQSNNVEECKYGGSMIGTTSASGFVNDTSIVTPFADTAKVSAYIASATGKQKYEKWNAEEYFAKTFTKYVNASTDEDGNVTSYTIIDAITPGIRSDTWVDSDSDSDKPAWIDGSAWNVDGTSAVLNQKHTYISDTYSNGTTICYITESCALRSWTTDTFSGEHSWDTFVPDGGIQSYIVIDTGTKRTNGKELYILLDKGTKDYFSFGAENTTRDVNVIIKGDYPVIFIIPEGTSYKTSPNLYIGHANIAVDLCDGVIDFDGLISTKRQLFSSFQNKITQIEGYIETVPAADTKSQPTALIKSSAPDFHNNIYLVTNSYTDTVDMNTQNIFYGYLYAPNAKFHVALRDPYDPANIGGAGNVIQFLGGMIVGSYRYEAFGSALAYLTPCDYKNVYGLPKKTDIVMKLMSIANGASGGGGGDLDVIIKPSTGDTPTLGYK